MRFGVADYGMNVWYGGLYDLHARLSDLKAIGLDGIERIEATCASDAMQQALVYHKLGMDFATVNGPKIINGIEWTCALGKNYVWIAPGPQGRDVDFDVYCRRTNDLLKALKGYHLKGVLHNHLGSRIENQDELDRFMNACPDAMLLLDVGHLHGAGGDCIRTIHQYHDRIEAIHFKDIELMDTSKGLDEWYLRLRFRELGAGNAGMDFDGMIQALRQHNYDGWVFIEQDCHTENPLIQLKTSLDILKKGFGY